MSRRFHHTPTRRFQINTFNQIILSAPGNVTLTSNNYGSISLTTGINANATTVTLNSGKYAVNQNSVFGTNALIINNGVTIYSLANARTLSVASQTWNGDWTYGSQAGNWLDTGTGAITLNASSIKLTNNSTFTPVVSGNITGTSNLTLSAASSGGITINGAVNNTGTITNSGSGSGSVNIGVVGGVGSNVTGITQNITPAI